MHPSIQFRTSSLPVRNLIGRALVCVALILAGLVPTLHAVTPAPGGGYPGENTAEGTNALFSLSSGIRNTAIGFNALFSDNAGGGNTATGDSALRSNTFGSGNTANGDSALLLNIVGNNNT